MAPEAIQWLPFLGQLGLAGVMLIVLFWGLKSGNIWTENAVKRLEESYRSQIAIMERYIVRLEATNDRVDERNDELAHLVGPAIEISRTTGKVQALPSDTAERIIR